MTFKLSRNLVLKALVQLLRPLVRFGLSNSIKLQDFIELVKQTYVSESGKKILESGDAPTVVRLSLVSGVHRKDVTRISREGQVLPEDLSIIARVIGQWRSDKRFLDNKGIPRILDIENAKNDFRELVSLVSKEINPSLILAELERVLAVKRIGPGIKLLSPAYVPSGDLKKGLEFLANDIEDLFEAVYYNLTQSPDDPNLHIKTVYDAIDPEQLTEIRQWLLKEGTEFHYKIDAYLSSFDTDFHPTKKHIEKGHKSI
jgi:hypothetical protein